MTTSAQEQQQPWFALWDEIIRAVEASVANAKAEYGEQAKSVRVLSVPARTLVVEANGKPVVQAIVSLTGDRIDITNQRVVDSVVVNFPRQIKIEMEGSRTVYVTDDERLSAASDVARIILDPVLDLYRMN